MFKQARLLGSLNTKLVTNGCIKYAHNGKKFIIGRKLFGNNQYTQCNKTIELDSAWALKLSAYHELLDMNNDGVVSVDDLTELIKRFSKFNNMTEKQSLMFSKIIKNLWYKHWGCIEPFDYITVEKYLSYIQHIQHNEGMRNEVVQLLPILFKAVDKDHNGDITPDEYEQFLKCVGTSKKNDLISLGIVNDKDNTINLNDIMFVIDKHFFPNKNETKK